jgi:hypothetical protein
LKEDLNNIEVKVTESEADARRRESTQAGLDSIQLDQLVRQGLHDTLVPANQRVAFIFQTNVVEGLESPNDLMQTI